MMKADKTWLSALRSVFGDHFQENVSLKRFTAARIGGNADYIVTVESAGELAKLIEICCQSTIPFIILGSGSNVLVSDKGVRQLVIINHARKSNFEVKSASPRVWAESGVNFGALARKAGLRGLSGLEWAAGIPGTVGGAVYGNAGAHGSDMSTCLRVANILHLTPSRNGFHHDIVVEDWQVKQFEYGYRSSRIKKAPGSGVVLSATLELKHSSPETVQARMEEYRIIRRDSQPAGASLGSIFKNPPGDYSGRLIEAAGLKGKKFGAVEVSGVHANFFVNQGNATASDYAGLITLVMQEVLDKFGVSLELEIELIGDWSLP